MTRMNFGRTTQVARAIVQGAVTLGALSALAVWAQNNGRGGRRTSRRGPGDDEMAEPPPVSDEQRLVEPLGPRVAWGYIEQLDSEYRSAPFELTRQIILLGRQAGCDIMLDDDRASRYHAMMLWDRGRGYLQDNGSLNGTNINGQRSVGPVPLRHGDLIEILSLRFRFMYSEQTGLNVMEAQPTERISSQSGPSGNDAARGGNMVVRLTALTGPEPGRSWPIGNSPMVIGRGTESIIMLPHASVSRRHAQITNQPDGIYVQDLNSSNGTSVNGEPLSAPRRLQNGDHVQVGDVLLVLAIEPADASAGAPAGGNGQWQPAAAQSPQGWGNANAGASAWQAASPPAGGQPPAAGGWGAPPPASPAAGSAPAGWGAPAAGGAPASGWGAPAPGGTPPASPGGWGPPSQPVAPAANGAAGWGAPAPATPQAPGAAPGGWGTPSQPTPPAAAPAGATPQQGWGAPAQPAPAAGAPPSGWGTAPASRPSGPVAPQQGWGAQPAQPAPTPAQPAGWGNSPPAAGSPPAGWPPPGAGTGVLNGPNPPAAGQGAPPQGWPPAGGPGGQGAPPAGWPPPGGANGPQNGPPPAGGQGGPPQGWPAAQPPSAPRPPAGPGQAGGWPQQPGSVAGGWPAPAGPPAQGGPPPAPQGWPPAGAPPNGDGENRVPRFQPPRQDDGWGQGQG